MPMLIIDGMSVLKTVAGPQMGLDNAYSYNFFSQLNSTVKKFKPKGIICCWEGGHEFRSRIYSDYKSDRKGSGELLKSQREDVQTILEHLGVDQVYCPGHEADDVGAWLVHNLGVPVILYTNDRDWLQLIRDGISVYQKSPGTLPKPNQRVEITRATFEQYVGYPSPEEFLKAKCLIGDGSDKVPGIFGVGEATVKAWIFNVPIPPSKKEKIEEFLVGDEFARNMLLMDLIRPREMELSWRKGALSAENVRSNFERLKFQRFLGKFDEIHDLYKNAIL